MQHTYPRSIVERFILRHHTACFILKHHKSDIVYRVSFHNTPHFRPAIPHPLFTPHMPHMPYPPYGGNRSARAGRGQKSGTRV